MPLSSQLTLVGMSVEASRWPVDLPAFICKISQPPRPPSLPLLTPKNLKYVRVSRKNWKNPSYIQVWKPIESDSRHLGETTITPVTTIPTTCRSTAVDSWWLKSWRLTTHSCSSSNGPVLLEFGIPSRLARPDSFLIYIYTWYSLTVVYMK